MGTVPDMRAAEWSPNLSPVGWYVGSYLLRFIELEAEGNDDPSCEFLVWENTVLVAAASLDEAYEKVMAVGTRATEPYQGGPDAVPVQWVFEGVSQLLPIYEELADGAEIMWEEHESMTLEKVRKRARPLHEFKSTDPDPADH